jgi:hypothetical protein
MGKNDAECRADVGYEEASGHEGSDAGCDDLKDAYGSLASFDMIAEVSQSWNSYDDARKAARATPQ